jgi:ribonuclease P protein component
MRLASPEVKRLLASGVRLNASAANLTFSSRTLPQEDVAAPIANARLAVAVPKRLLKRAVDRNRAKRALRESFRQGDIRGLNIDTLITLTHFAKPKDVPRRRMMKSLRAAADALFSKVASSVAGKASSPMKRAQ